MKVLIPIEQKIQIGGAYDTGYFTVTFWNNRFEQKEPRKESHIMIFRGK